MIFPKVGLTARRVLQVRQSGVGDWREKALVMAQDVGKKPGFESARSGNSLRKRWHKIGHRRPNPAGHGHLGGGVSLADYAGESKRPVPAEKSRLERSTHERFDRSRG